MAIRKLKGAWWVDFRFGRRRYRWKSPDDSHKGAVAYELHLKRRLINGEDITQRPIQKRAEDVSLTFAVFSKEWFANYVVPNSKPSTRRAKRMILDKHLIPYFGQMPLASINKAEVEKFKAIKKGSRLSPKTVNNILSAFSMSLRSAQEWGYIENTIKIGWLKVPPQSFDFLTEAEVELLLWGGAPELWHTMILMALRTGMRHGELTGLDWKDVNLTDQRITVRQSLVGGILGSPKNNRIRHIPISQDLMDALNLSRSRKGYVFAREDGKTITAGHSLKALRRICERIGMRVVRWHALRHTFASHLVMKGAPIRAVQVLMGHSSIQMTERYAHLAPSTLQETIDLLDRPKEIKVGDFGHHVGTNKSLPVMKVIDVA